MMYIMVLLVFQPTLAVTVLKLVTQRLFLGHGESHCTYWGGIHKVKKGEEGANVTML